MTKFDRSKKNAEPLLVVDPDTDNNIVIMNQTEYDNLIETIRIYQNPTMRERIRRNMHDATVGNTASHSLIDIENT